MIVLMQWLNYSLTNLAFSCSMLLGASVVHAHPHNWIVLNSSFVLDDDARLVQVKQRWEFDAYFSTITLADVLNEHGSEEIGLSKAASDIIKNLAGFNYFSKLSVDGAETPLVKPVNYAFITKKKEGQIILELEMTFDLENALHIQNKSLAWQVYDPTYFIAMNHATENNIEIIGGNGTECAKTLELPEPPNYLVDYAQSLDRSQKDADDLGADFAETAFINCY